MTDGAPVDSRASVNDRAPVDELRALTGVRGVAAWFVVFYHIRLSIAGLPIGVRDVFAKGYLAVDFFFLLSGFVIWLTWNDRIRAGGMASVPRFLQKRIARIWPLHLVTLAGAVALALLLRATGREDPQFVFSELPLHVLLLQNWGFTRHLAWNDPSWSISAELGAYLLFPFLVIAVDWRRVPSILLLAIAGILLFVMHAAIGAPSLGADIPRFGLLRCLVEFTTGSIVCALWLRWRSVSHAALYAAISTTLLATLWIVGAPETMIVPAVFASLLLLLALTAGRPRNPLELPVIHYLGEISYATYLSHFILWKAFKLAFVSEVAVSPIVIALYLLLVLLASTMLYHLVERPAQRWLNAPPSRSREGAQTA